VPFCPNCRSEYRPGIETCADCGEALVAELPARYEPPPSSGNDVAIARTDSMAIAEMWAGLLGDEHINCRIVPANVGDTGLVPGQAEWEVRVAAIDAPRALEVLPSDAPDEDEPEHERGEAELERELSQEVADAENQQRAIRWLVVAGVIFVVLMAWVILANIGR
jgi:hypothetical protein